jgi:branched-subunit amino acid permease
MNRAIYLVLLVAGVVLVVLGIIAADSLGSDISRFFTGEPTDKSIWMLISGVVLCIIGAAGALYGSKSAP